MKLKRLICLMLSALILLCCMSALAAEAAGNPADCKYTLKGTYDSENQQYVIQVALETNIHLMAGTFGVRYDSALDDNISFALNLTNFTLFNNFGDQRLVPNPATNDHPVGYLIFQWYLNDIEQTTGTIPLGTITVKNINSEDMLADWYTDTFRVQNWMGTPVAQEDQMKDVIDGFSLNDEIWRNPTPEELQENPNLLGWYQAYDTEASLGEDFNPGEIPSDAVWHDLGFEFTSDIQLKDGPFFQTDGTAKSWNPNKSTVLYFIPMVDGQCDYTDLSYRYEGEGISQPNGRVEVSYSVPQLRPGQYAVMAEKDVHLTLKKNDYIEILDQNVTNDQSIDLYCGDITDDEWIRLNDRAILLKYLNTQSFVSEDEIAVRSDLNGDGKVTIADFNILKMYYNKKY